MEGDALVKELTGAQVMAMAEDVPALERMRPGGKPHPIDRVLHDGDAVTLGGTTLVARLTPGHTEGCTTWTMKVQEGGRTLRRRDHRQHGQQSRLPVREQQGQPRTSPTNTSRGSSVLRSLQARRPARLASGDVRHGGKVRRGSARARIRSSTRPATQRSSTPSRGCSSQVLAAQQKAAAEANR